MQTKGNTPFEGGLGKSILFKTGIKFLTVNKFTQNIIMKNNH